MDKFSFLGNADTSSIEDLFQLYLKDHNSVEYGWQKFFEGFEFASKNYEKAPEIPQNVKKEFDVINNT